MHHPNGRCTFALLVSKKGISTRRDICLRPYPPSSRGRTGSGSAQSNGRRVPLKPRIQAHACGCSSRIYTPRKNGKSRGNSLSALQAGTICLALNCGAYMAEIVRAGIQSVDPGQMEAARSLGLTYGMAMRKVVLPQAIRTMIPTFINQFIITLKDTSILSVIGFPELVNTAKNVQANTFMSFQTWAVVGIMYLIVITILSRSAKMVERRLSIGR